MLPSSEVAVFVARRLLGLFAVLLIVSFLVFAFIYAAPGSPEAAIVGQERATPEVIEAVRVRYQLDQPFVVQYWHYLTQVVHLDLGSSMRTGIDVRTEIAARCGVTIPLAVIAIVIAMISGTCLGGLAALRRGTAVDRATVALSTVGVSAPAFASGVILLYVFGIVLGWFPVFGEGTGIGDRLWHLTLPAITLALTGMASIVRITRASMIQTLDQDYVTFARARGLPASTVVVAHALRNALMSIVTASGSIFGLMLAGSIVVESTFSLKGVGLYLMEGVNRQDIPVIQGVTIAVASLVVVVNLGIDLLYMVIDPRVRFEQAAA